MNLNKERIFVLGLCLMDDLTTQCATAQTVEYHNLSHCVLYNTAPHLPLGQ